MPLGKRLLIVTSDGTRYVFGPVGVDGFGDLFRNGKPWGWAIIRGSGEKSEDGQWIIVTAEEVQVGLYAIFYLCEDDRIWVTEAPVVSCGFLE